MAYIPYAATALLGLSLFFALLGNSLRRYSIARLEERLRDRGHIQRLSRFLDLEDELVLATSVWRLVVNTLYVAVLAVYIREGEPLRAWTMAIAGGIGLLVFGAAIPLAWARVNSEAPLARCIPILLAIRTVSLPLLVFLRLFEGLVRRLAGRSGPENPDEDLEDDLRSVVMEGELEGTLEEEEKEMIESIIQFKDTDVGQIMTPRTEMLCLPQDATLAAARDFVTHSGHSRVPVYQENLDVIVGVLYAKDLLAATAAGNYESRPVSDIMRAALFIPETKNITDLLRDFQREGVHIAIVLDEYGGTAGLLTIEDIIEEIFGEIADEYDISPPEEIHHVGEHTAEVDARARIVDVNDELNIELPEDEHYETLGGFVLSELGYIPKPGERLEYRGLAITILDAEERKVNRMRLEGLDRFVRETD